MINIFLEILEEGRKDMVTCMCLDDVLYYMRAYGIWHMKAQRDEGDIPLYHVPVDEACAIESSSKYKYLYKLIRRAVLLGALR